MLSSELANSASMWAYNKLATAPPAEWPVNSKEHVLREGFSSRSDRRRAATGLTILRATDRKPEWQRLPESSCTTSASGVIRVDIDALGSLWETLEQN